MEKDKSKTGVENIDKLFDDTRADGVLPMIRNNTEQEPPILMCELELAIKELPMGKAKGEDFVTNEMIKSLGIIGKRFLTVLNEIYESGELPSDLFYNVTKND